MDDNTGAPAAELNAGISLADHNAALSKACGEAKAEGAAEGKTLGFAEGKAAGLAEGVAEGEKTGAAAAKVRFAAITGSAEAAGRTQLAYHFAASTDMTAEAAVAALAVSPKEGAVSPLSSAMGSQPSNSIGSPMLDTERPSPAANLISMAEAQAARAKQSA